MSISCNKRPSVPANATSSCWLWAEWASLESSFQSTSWDYLSPLCHTVNNVTLCTYASFVVSSFKSSYLGTIFTSQILGWILHSRGKSHFTGNWLHQYRKSCVGDVCIVTLPNIPEVRNYWTDAHKKYPKSLNCDLFFSCCFGHVVVMVVLLNDDMSG